MPVLRRAAALAAALEDRRSVAVAGHPRQDDDHVAADRRRAGVRPRPVLRYRRQPLRDRQQRAPRQRCRLAGDRRGGRERRLVPAAPARSAAIVTNVEADHLENHGDLDGIFRAFEQFVDRVAPGRVAAGLRRRRRGAARSRELRARAGGRVRHLRRRARTPTSGSPTSSPAPDARRVHGHRAGSGRRPCRVGALIGRHMALNAAAALAMAAELGARPRTRSSRVVARLRRRAPPLRVPRRGGRRAGVRRLRPPPDRDRCAAARRPGRVVGGGRLVAVFQPGTYSRTQTFAREFADGDGARRRRRRDGHLPGARGAHPGRDRRDDQRPDRPARRAGGATSRATARVPARIAAFARPGDLVRHDGHRQRLSAVRRHPRRGRRGTRRADRRDPDPVDRPDTAPAAAWAHRSRMCRPVVRPHRVARGRWPTGGWRPWRPRSSRRSCCWCGRSRSVR